MPLASGTLKEYIAAGQDNILRSALFDILAGLEEIHKNKIVHRDLKPENILSFENKKGELRFAISDFGLITASSNESSTLTGTNAGGGTVMYAAPECIRDFKRAIPQSDIYSFGAILHDIFVRRARTPYTELSGPDFIKEQIEKCTKKDPILRYSNIKQLRAELYNAIKDISNEHTNISSNEKKVIESLQSKKDLSDTDCQELYYIISESSTKEPAIERIYELLTREHIYTIRQYSEDTCKAIGMYFAEYVLDNAFNFNYCDILCDKLMYFYDFDFCDLRVKILLALLHMGTSHNRWYVEEQFVQLVNHKTDDNLINMLLIEIEVSEEIDYIYELKHLLESLVISKNRLHPKIAEKL
jgi:hypothetical protein